MTSARRCAAGARGWPPLGPALLLALLLAPVDGAVRFSTVAAPPISVTGNGLMALRRPGAFTVEAHLGENSEPRGTVASIGPSAGGPLMEVSLVEPEDGSGTNLVADFFGVTTTHPVSFPSGQTSHIAVIFQLVCCQTHFAVTVLLNGVAVSSELVRVAHPGKLPNQEWTYEIGPTTTLVQEVRFWDMGRSATQVHQMLSRRASGNETNLIFSMPLDDGFGLSPRMVGEGTLDVTGVSAVSLEWVEDTALLFPLFATGLRSGNAVAKILPNPERFPYGVGDPPFHITTTHILPLSQDELLLFSGCDIEPAINTILGAFPGTWSYRVSTDTWTELDLEHQPPRRCLHGGAARDGKVYIMGGREHQLAIDATGGRSDTWVFDDETRSWSELSPMPRASSGHIAVPIDDTILCIGGALDLLATTYNTSLMYDIPSDTWSVVTLSGASPSIGGTVHMFGNNRLIYFSGRNAFIAEPSSDLYVLWLDTLTWQLIGTAPDMLSVSLGGMMMIGSKFLVTHGFTGSPDDIENVILEGLISYDIQTNEWESLTSVWDGGIDAPVAYTVSLGDFTRVFFSHGGNLERQSQFRIPSSQAMLRADSCPESCSDYDLCVSGFCHSMSPQADGPPDEGGGGGGGGSDNLVTIVVSVILVSVIGLVLVAMLANRRARKSRVAHEKALLLFVSRDEFELDQRVAISHINVVYKGTWRSATVAVKQFQASSWTPAIKEQFRADIMQISALRHPNLIIHMALCMGDPTFLLSEHMELGSLRDVIQRNQRLLVDPIPLKIASEIAKALSFLHESNVLHTRLLSTNVLMDERLNVKLSDAGMGKFHQLLRGQKEVTGDGDPPLWNAPEVLSGESPTWRSDIYSFGLILWELRTKRVPFVGYHPIAAARQVVEESLRPVFPSHVDGRYRKLVERCWDANPKNRPTSLEALVQLDDIRSNRHDSNALTMFLNDPSSTSAAVCFAAIEGMDALWSEIGGDCDVAFDIFVRTVEKVAHESGHSVIKTTSDYGVLAYMGTAIEAVSFAVELQRQLKAVSDWPQSLVECNGDTPPLVMTIAVHILDQSRLALNAGRGVSDLVDLLQAIVEVSPSGCIMATGVAVETLPGLEFDVLKSAIHVTCADKGTHVNLGNSKTPMQLFQVEVSAGGVRLQPAGSQQQQSRSAGSGKQSANVIMVGDRTSDGRRSISSISGVVVEQASVITWSEISLSSKVLGTGSFGEVTLADYKGQSVAVKRLLQQKMTKSAQRYFASEVDIVSRLHHPNIVQFIGVVTDPHVALVMEYVPRGSLWGILRANPNAIRGVRRQLALGIAKGMAYLHVNRVINRDLKSPNVLLSETMEAKLTDFGLARVKSDTQTMSRVGSIVWTAPEILQGKRYSERADIFSFGIVLWEMYARIPPYADRPNIGQLELATLVFKGVRPTISKGMEKTYPTMVDVMRQAWQAADDARPTFSDCIGLVEAVPESEG